MSAAAVGLHLGRGQLAESLDGRLEPEAEALWAGSSLEMLDLDRGVRSPLALMFSR